ncbi:MAG: DMT family transporter [Candidatus Korarchaeum sp.]|nr:DMT family transporter [Candidatus Korarchaeum sp.]MDW8036356.1 DMT family transporter [Candidatus Korarchaeum sp.]
MSRSISRMGLNEWLLMIVLSVIWGSSFLFMGVLVRELPPLTITASRLILAALLLNLALMPKGNPRFPWRDLLILGLTNNTIPYALILWGQVYITSSLASILNSTAPFFTSVLAQLLTDDEKLTKSNVAGAIVGFSGTLIMLGPDALRSNHNLVGQLMVLAGVICYSYATVFSRKLYGMGLSSGAIASGQLITAALTALPLAIILDKPWTLPNLSARAWASMICLSVLSTALAYAIFFRVLESAGATQVNLVTLLIPVTATLLCTTLLGERLEDRHLLGMVVILIGLIIADGRLGESLRRLRSVNS